MEKLNQYTGFIFLLLSSYAFGQNTEQKVDIPDFYLEQAIRNHFDKPTGEITKTDMESLTRFIGDGRGISDVKGLEYATNITYLKLDDNKICDLTPLDNPRETRKSLAKRK